MRWCWVDFQCRGVLLIWGAVGQGLTALAVCAGGGCLDIFSLICHFSFLSPSLWETARYRLKYCLKGPLSTKQPTNPDAEETVAYRWIGFFNYRILPQPFTNFSECGRICPCRRRYWKRHPVISMGMPLLK